MRSWPALPGSDRPDRQLPATSGMLSAAFDRLVVMADLEDPEKLPFGWSPLALDAGKPGSTLADWTLLPFAGPGAGRLPGLSHAGRVSA